ncbi:hypothetical protein Q427_10895 [Halomonas sp. BC04]|nr:hypothetical protein Q427_10895 [Halomonas sp. BC04]
MLENGSDIEVVGDDLQPLMIEQGFRHHFVAGADIDEE